MIKKYRAIRYTPFIFLLLILLFGASCNPDTEDTDDVDPNEGNEGDDTSDSICCEWKVFENVTEKSIKGIHGIDKDTVFVTHGSCISRRMDDIWIKDCINSDPSKLWVFSKDHVFALCGSSIFQFDGSAWKKRWDADDYIDFNWMRLKDIFGMEEGKIYSVGNDEVIPGDVFRSYIIAFDGWEWKWFTDDGWYSLYSIWGSPTSEMIIVGGNIIYFDGEGWSTMDLDEDIKLENIYGLEDNDVYATGRDMNDKTGVIYHYDGVVWKELKRDQWYFELWGTKETGLYVYAKQAGENVGSILHYDGVDWNEEITGPWAINGIWGSSREDIYAVGSNYENGKGVILHYGESNFKIVFEE